MTVALYIGATLGVTLALLRQLGAHLHRRDRDRRTEKLARDMAAARPLSIDEARARLRGTR